MDSTKHRLYLLHWLSQSKNCPDGKVIMFSVSMPQSRSKLHLERKTETQAKAFVVAHTDSWPKHEILNMLSCKKLPHKLKLSARTSGWKVCIKLPRLMHSCVIGATTYKSENNEILKWDWTAQSVKGAVLGLSFISNRVTNSLLGLFTTCQLMVSNFLSRRRFWEEWNLWVWATTAAVFKSWRKLCGSTSRNMTCVRPNVKGSLNSYQTETSMQS